MIHRDRNHPSIILWSIGNEIPEQSMGDGRQMAKRLADICPPRRPHPSRDLGLQQSGRRRADTGYAEPWTCSASTITSENT